MSHKRTEIPEPGPVTSQADGHAVDVLPESEIPFVPQHAPARPHRWRRRLIWAGVVLLVVGGLVSWSVSRRAAPAPGPVIAESGALSMRAEVRPARRAMLSVIYPGTVEELFAITGQAVDSKAPIARVQGPSGAEILVAPWRGTVTTVQAHVGDTLQPGAVVATMADLTQLQVETVDVDEFQVAKLQPGQPVTLTIDALNQTIPGRVRSIALEPLVNATGDANYLTVIDPGSRPTGLRSGMTVRVRVAD